METRLKLGILTLSDKASRGLREDTSGPAIAEVLAPLNPEIVEKTIIPDEPEQITATLREWLDRGSMNLIVTTGGTGLGPRDHTPEATRPLIDRDVPGMAELMRLEGLKKTPMAAISRGLVGLSGQTLIINLPGSEKAVRESLAALLPVLQHALNVIAGDTERHPTG